MMADCTGSQPRKNSLPLYYKADQVADPARDLDDLRSQASRNRAVAIPIGFQNSFWGLVAFGVITVSDDYLPVFRKKIISIG